VAARVGIAVVVGIHQGPSDSAEEDLACVPYRWGFVIGFLAGLDNEDLAIAILDRGSWVYLVLMGHLRSWASGGTQIEGIAAHLAVSQVAGFVGSSWGYVDSDHLA
jgi:hypothetical protein